MGLIRIFIVALFLALISIVFTGCELTEDISKDIDVELIIEDIESRPVDYLNIRVSELKFEAIKGIQDGFLTFSTGSDFQPIPGKVELSEGLAEVELSTYAEDEMLKVTVKLPNGKKVDNFLIALDNVEPKMATEIEALGDEDYGDFDITRARYGFFMAPFFQSTICEDKEHDFYAYYSASAFVDLRLDELNAVVRHMIETEENSFFVNAWIGTAIGFSSYYDFSREYSSTNPKHPLDLEKDEEARMNQFFFAAKIDYVGDVCDDLPTPTGYVPDEYMVTFFDPDRGILEARVDDEPIESGDRIAEGSDIEFEIIYLDEPLGLEVDKWLVNGEVMPDEDDLSYVYENLQEAIEVTVELEEAPFFAVKINKIEGTLNQLEDEIDIMVDFTVTNKGLIDGTQDIKLFVYDVEDEPYHDDIKVDKSLEPQDVYEDDFQFSLDISEEGEYLIEVTSEDDSDSIWVKIKYAKGDVEVTIIIHGSPEAPYDLEINDDDTYLQWEHDDADNVEFTILRSESSDLEEVDFLVPVATVAETNYPLENLQAGYYYWVRAYDKEDGYSSDLSNYVKYEGGD